MRHTYDTDPLPERVQLDPEALVIAVPAVPPEHQLAQARDNDRTWRERRWRKFRNRRLAIVQHCEASRQFTHRLDSWVWTLALFTFGLSPTFRPLWYVTGILLVVGVGAHLYDIIIWKLSLPLLSYIQRKAKRDGYWLKG